MTYKLKQNGPDRTISVESLAAGNSFPVLFNGVAIDVVGMMDCEWCDLVRIRLLTTSSNVRMRFLWYTPPDLALVSGGLSIEEYPSVTFLDWISSTTGDQTPSRLWYAAKTRTSEEGGAAWHAELFMVFNRSFTNAAVALSNYAPPILGRYLYPVVKNDDQDPIDYLLTIERTYRGS